MPNGANDGLLKSPGGLRAAFYLKCQIFARAGLSKNPADDKCCGDGNINLFVGKFPLTHFAFKKTSPSHLASFARVLMIKR